MAHLFQVEERSEEWGRRASGSVKEAAQQPSALEEADSPFAVVLIAVGVEFVKL
jgi:hypothetical protein